MAECQGQRGHLKPAHEGSVHVSSVSLTPVLVPAQPQVSPVLFADFRASAPGCRRALGVRAHQRPREHSGTCPLASSDATRRALSPLQTSSVLCVSAARRAGASEPGSTPPGGLEPGVAPSGGFGSQPPVLAAGLPPAPAGHASPVLGRPRRPPGRASAAACESAWAPSFSRAFAGAAQVRTSAAVSGQARPPFPGPWPLRGSTCGRVSPRRGTRRSPRAPAGRV